jgi:hypothetical protein
MGTLTNSRWVMHTPNCNCKKEQTSFFAHIITGLKIKVNQAIVL